MKSSVTGQSSIKILSFYNANKNIPFVPINFLFQTDSYSLVFNGEDGLMDSVVPWNSTGIAWKTDISGKFNNPSGGPTKQGGY